MTLRDDQLERYTRHIVLKEIGGAGQQRLLSAHVTLIGAGGIGCPAITALAAAGVGHLRVIDDDSVSLSNLQRQTLYGTQDVGAPKGEAAMQAVARLNPDVRLVPIMQRIDSGNAETLLRHSDVVIDGSDNFATRLAVSDAATRLRIPLVSAAVGQFEGQLGVFRGWEEDQPCYRCMVGDNPGRNEGNCSEAGVLGALTGMLGHLAALEAIRQIVPFGQPMAGRMLIADLLGQRYRTLTLRREPDCPVCAQAACPA